MSTRSVLSFIVAVPAALTLTFAGAAAADPGRQSTVPAYSVQGGAAPSAAAAALSGPEQAAMSWATPYADSGDTSYNGLCLTFVFDAYTAAGINLRNEVDVPIGADTYPSDIWGHFTAGSTGTDTPPAGALVFWASTTGDRTLSHVALSLGGGNLVSTSDSVAGNTHYETMDQHTYATLLGWWLPDA